jgi:4'-phosphopantetheinyl transferase
MNGSTGGQTILLFGSTNNLNGTCCNRLLNSLPASVRTTVMEPFFEKDRKLRLMGKLLLDRGLALLGVHYPLHIKKGSFNRPWINRLMDFNISHSGSMAVCVVSNETRVGVDIEQYRNLDIQTYHQYLTPKELDKLSSSEHPENAFIKMWTIKESVAKAEGGGLQLPFNTLCTQRQNIQTKHGSTWLLKHILLDTGHACTLSHKNAFIHLSIFGTAANADKHL